MKYTYKQAKFLEIPLLIPNMNRLDFYVDFLSSSAYSITMRLEQCQTPQPYILKEWYKTNKDSVHVMFA